MSHGVRLIMVILFIGEVLGGVPPASAQMDGIWHITEVNYCDEVVSGTSLAFDSAGYAHVSYLDHGAYLLKYAWQDASGWHNISITGSGKAAQTSIALDGTGRARISYYGGSDDLILAVQKPSGWSLMTLDSDGDVGKWSDLELDANNRPHICYWDGSNNQLKYGYLSGSSPYQVWVTSVVDDTDYATCSLALDAEGNPHISYYDAAVNGHVTYAFRDAQGWHKTVVDSVPSVAQYLRSLTSLALACDGTPAIAYDRETGLNKANLMFAKLGSLSKKWHITTVDSGENTRYASLALQSCPDPSTSYFAISYNNFENDELRYAYQNSTGWHTTPVISGNGVAYTGTWNSLAFFNPANPSIAFRFGTSLMYARYEGPVIVLPGLTHPPTDPDGDGIYEDLNGNGRLDFADVVLYFNQMTWIGANEPISAFDLNGSGRIDFADIVALFNEI